MPFRVNFVKETLNFFVASDTQLVIENKNPGTGQTIGDPYIQAFTGSIKAGNPFTITAANVPTPSNLSNPYIIRVLVADPLDQETILIYGCANATIGEALGEEA
ncbi:hypothetical protein RclHR1_02140021 [Rhizophagus clarus]|uniref:Uncharacterized protein n=1 Tax=Rhizophagus clarus TaxID=94130 RepID=A0A2Z6RLY7_9GLOM|nr:hypothetical protein RclHR1_02140021 [Rhizophagus clarus]